MVVIYFWLVLKELQNEVWLGKVSFGLFDADWDWQWHMQQEVHGKQVHRLKKSRLLIYIVWHGWIFIDF